MISSDNDFSLFKRNFDLGIWDKERVTLIVKLIVKYKPSTMPLSDWNETLSVQRALDSDNCCQTFTKGPTY